MKTKHTITAAVLALAAASAQAAPYAITHQGVIVSGPSLIPGLGTGQPYSLTLVMDNGSTDADEETWEPQHLTCAIWRMGNAPQIVAAHDMALSPPMTANGTVETNGSGDLTGVFSEVRSGAITAAAIRTRGLPPGETLQDWIANTGNSPVLYTAPNTLRLRVVEGGVQMDAAHWSSPVPFTGNCLDAAGPASAGGGIASVPTLGHAALALLSAFVGGLGLRMRRRNS